MNRLWDWKAIRARKPPNTKDEIATRGLVHLGEIAAHYTRLVASSGAEPTISDLCWEDVIALFDLVSEIKGGSPVFASKMCHFLFPKVFIVMDNLATGVFEYEFYWRGMKDEWCRFRDKAEARSVLTAAIKSARPLHPLYPMETKIMELSQIGYEYG